MSKVDDWLKSLKPEDSRMLQEYVESVVKEWFTQHLQQHHQYQPPMTFGGDSPDVKPEGDTTIPTPATDITDISNLVLELGEVLVELDYHLTTLTTFRNRLQSSYNNVVAGVNGLGVQEN